MLFNSFVFLFAFLPVTYLVFWRLETASQRYVWLAVSGYVFYASWNPWFCLLMAFTTLVSFTAGLGFLRHQSGRWRHFCLVVPISVDLLVLAFFKYANFAVTAVNAAFAELHIDLALPTAIPTHGGGEFRLSDIVLPIGISFYTFHTISYIVDAYRRVITPTRNLFEFVAYVSLFSQLVAGPIVRFRQIEDDLANLGRADRSRWLALGASFFVAGLVQKTLIADTLAAFVDPAFESYRTWSTADAWLANLGYAFQLYFDFAGYSNMAIGLGYLFGLRIPINFNSPYKALDPSDFWRRWHISLSTCLRDYVYIPLGGSRFGSFATYRNLLMTMMIGGLWHGANWTFVIWGLYHGVLLCLYRLSASHWDRLPSVFRRIATFLLVVIGWVFFRSPDLTTAFEILRIMFLDAPQISQGLPMTFALAIALAGLAAMAAPNAQELHHNFVWRRTYTLLYPVAFGACLALIASGRNSPFLYFQF